jgi:hypothetical protein
LQTTTKIDSLADAVWYFLNEAEYHSYKIVSRPMGARGPICVIAELISYDKDNAFGVTEERKRRYYIFFKREFLHSFKYLFNMPKEGFGQTVNYDILRQAGRDGMNTSIVIVMPPTSIYYIKAKDMLAYVQENNTIRTPSTEAGQEASVPARLLQSIDEY